jgi:histone chaperone ASF1
VYTTWNQTRSAARDAISAASVLDRQTAALYTSTDRHERTSACSCNSALCRILFVGVCAELEWKVIYVGSAQDESLDQELDSVLVGPVAEGKNQFLFVAPPPNHAKIPEKDLLDVTAILLTCSYRDKEFIRIGYYVNNEYVDAEWQARCVEVQARNEELTAKYAEESKSNKTLPPPTLQPLPPIPSPLNMNKVQRNILSDKPRVTRFEIPWDSDDQKMPDLTEEEKKMLQENEIALAAAGANGNAEGAEDEEEESEEEEADGAAGRGAEDGEEDLEDDDDGVDGADDESNAMEISKKK